MKDLSPTRARVLWHRFITDAATMLNDAYELPARASSTNARVLVDRALAEFARALWLCVHYEEAWTNGDRSVRPSSRLLDLLATPEKARLALADEREAWAYIAQWTDKDHWSHLCHDADRSTPAEYRDFEHAGEIFDEMLCRGGAHGSSNEIKAVAFFIEKLLVFDGAHAVNRTGLFNDDTIAEQSLLLPITRPMLFESVVTTFELEVRKARRAVRDLNTASAPPYAKLLSDSVPHRVVHGVWPFLDARSRAVVHSSGIAANLPWYGMCQTISHATNVGFRVPRGMIQLVEQEIAVRELSVEQRALASNMLAKARLLDPVDESESYALICRDQSEVRLPYEELRVGTVAGGVFHCLWPYLTKNQRTSIRRFGAIDRTAWPAMALGLRDAATMNELAHRSLSYLATSSFQSVFAVGTQSHALTGVDRKRSI